MVKPLPYKVKCPKCGYSRIIKPKSDVMIEEAVLTICPICKCGMTREELNFVDKFFMIFSHK